MTQPHPSARWSGVAEAYARTFAGQCAHAVRPLVEGLGAVAGIRWLDVGTGAGAVAAMAGSLGCAVTGVDPEDDMLDLARQAVPTGTFVRGALPQLPFADGSFEAVSANFVLNHVADPPAAAAELARVTARGGRVGVTVWPSAPFPLRTLWDDVIADAGVPVPAAASAVPAEHDFARTPEGVAELLSVAGLTGLRAWQHTFTHVVAPDLWWSGARAGVARIGQVYLAQDEDGRAALTAAFEARCARHLGPDGLLHLPGAAVVAIGVRE